MESIFISLSQWLYSSRELAIFSAFLWGMFSIILSPCHLSSILLIVSYISSEKELNARNSIIYSLSFAFGILIAMAIIGGITFAMGRMLGDIGFIGDFLISLVFIVFGLYLMELINLPWINTGNFLAVHRIGVYRTLLLGIFFGIGLGPCAFAFLAPILGIVFSSAAQEPVFSAGLLVSFSLGHCFLISLAGIGFFWFQKYLNWTGNSRIFRRIKQALGLILIIFGIYWVYKSFL